MYIIGVPEGGERKNRVKNVFDEIMAEKFLSLKKKPKDFQVQKTKDPQTR